MTGLFEGFTARQAARQLEGFAESFVGQHGQFMEIQRFLLALRHDLTPSPGAIRSASDRAARSVGQVLFGGLPGSGLYPHDFR